TIRLREVPEGFDGRVGISSTGSSARKMAQLSLRYALNCDDAAKLFPRLRRRRHDFCWHAGYDRMRRNVVGDHAVGSHNAAFSDCDTLQDKATFTDPGSSADVDRFYFTRSCMSPIKTAAHECGVAVAIGDRATVRYPNVVLDHKLRGCTKSKPDGRCPP